MRWDKMDTDKILYFIEEVCPKAVLLDGYADCILGITISRPNNTNIVYSQRMIIEKLMKEKMSYFEAMDYFEENIEAIKHPIHITPIYFNDIPHPSLN